MYKMLEYSIVVYFTCGQTESTTRITGFVEALDEKWQKKEWVLNVLYPIILASYLGFVIPQTTCSVSITSRYKDEAWTSLSFSFSVSMRFGSTPIPLASVYAPWWDYDTIYNTDTCLYEFIDKKKRRQDLFDPLPVTRKIAAVARFSVGGNVFPAVL